jgi:hypothetical protein
LEFSKKGFYFRKNAAKRSIIYQLLSFYSDEKTIPADIDLVANLSVGTAV